MGRDDVGPGATRGKLAEAEPGTRVRGGLMHGGHDPLAGGSGGIVAGVDAPDPTPAGPRVEAAFAAHYGDGAVRRVARAPEGDALGGIAAYRGDDHWHLVTLGLADVVPANRDGAAPGPLGHELTLITPATARPPAWAFALLDGAARTAIAVGRPFHPGARMAPGAPVDGARSSLVALGIRADPLVPSAGPVAVLQAVGVTLREYGLMRRVGTALVLERLADRDPLLRTDPGRA